MEEKVGTKLDLPDLLSEPVLVALVGETDGVVTHGLFAEAEIEVCAIGSNPLPPSQMRDAEAYILSVCDRFKIRMVRAFVPTSLVPNENSRKPGALERILKNMGFTRESESLVTQFYRWVKPAGGRPAGSGTEASGEAKTEG
jgi:hypothetical protein